MLPTGVKHVDVASLLNEVTLLRNEVYSLKKICSAIKEICVGLRRNEQFSTSALQDALLPLNNSAQLVTCRSADE